MRLLALHRLVEAIVEVAQQAAQDPVSGIAAVAAIGVSYRKARFRVRHEASVYTQEG